MVSECKKEAYFFFVSIAHINLLVIGIASRGAAVNFHVKKRQYQLSFHKVFKVFKAVLSQCMAGVLMYPEKCQKRSFKISKERWLHLNAKKKMKTCKKSGGR